MLVNFLPISKLIQFFRVVIVMILFGEWLEYDYMTMKKKLTRASALLGSGNFSLVK